MLLMSIQPAKETYSLLTKQQALLRMHVVVVTSSKSTNGFTYLEPTNWS